MSKLGTERLISNLKLSATACCRIGKSTRPGGHTQRTRAWASGDQHQPHMQPPVQRRSADPHRPTVHSARTAFPRRGHTPATATASALASTSGGRHTGAAPQRHPNHPALEDTNSARLCHVDYCTFCGESNHRSHNCRYGMYVRCFQCHRDGHIQKFCDYYR